MKESIEGSPDGMRVVIYQKGYEYSLPEKLADAFVDQMKVAVFVSNKKEAVSPPSSSSRKRKAVTAAPENAAVTAAPENAAVTAAPENANGDRSFIRVYKLADDLDVSSKDLLKTAKALGISVGSVQAGLSKKQAAQIKKALKR